MPIYFQFADFPHADMVWVCTATALYLLADRRVPLWLIVHSLSLALSWIERPPPPCTCPDDGHSTAA